MDQVNHQTLHEFIQLALNEDVGDGDHTSLSTIPADATGIAKILIKEKGILAGMEVSLAIFKEVDPTLITTTFSKDGDEVHPGDVIDRKSTRLNSSHVKISYAVFCLKKKKK